MQTELEWFDNQVSIALTFSWRKSIHIETSPLVCIANHWTGFYRIETSVKKELDNSPILVQCHISIPPENVFRWGIEM